MKKNYFDKASREKVLAVNERDLENAFAAVEADWNQFLKDEELKLPQSETSKGQQLAILKHFQGKAVDKNDIAEKIAQRMNKPQTDQQVRHLKTQGGWYVLNRGDVYSNGGVEQHNPDGCHVLITTERPHPNATLQRRTAVAKGDWDGILKQYDNQCASCGAKIGEYHRYDSSFKVETLECGHMNPNKPLAPGNIIPQCRWCNRSARGDFTFDEQGRPRAVASVRPVSRAGSDVIAAIKNWIRKKQK